jgi:hypothetical protein
MPSLDGWENFYVIVGSSAAALTGLMFVVITLNAEANASYDDAIGAFSTPTVLHFCFVLLIAAIVSVPRHTQTSLAVCLGITGVTGLAYTILAIARIRHQKEYAPVMEDWIWHVILPLLAYAVICVAVFGFWRHSGIMLYMVAASVLLILYIGIHNAWDAAMFLTVERRSGAQRSKKKSR